VRFARRFLLGLGTMSAVLLVASPAAAKLPPYTIELSTHDPVVGEAIDVTVRFWDDRQHTDRARWPDLHGFDAFLWAVPFEPGEGFLGLGGAISIDVRRVRPGVYRGEVALPEAGRWALCPWSTSPCPASGPARGYPGRIELLAGAAPSPAAVVPAPSTGNGATVPVTVVVMSAFVFGAAATLRRLRARRG
jgi:hypothetical protein